MYFLGSGGAWSRTQCNETNVEYVHLEEQAHFEFYLSCMFSRVWSSLLEGNNQLDLVFFTSFYDALVIPSKRLGLRRYASTSRIHWSLKTGSEQRRLFCPYPFHCTSSRPTPLCQDCGRFPVFVSCPGLHGFKTNWALLVATSAIFFSSSSRIAKKSVCHIVFMDQGF